MTANANVIEVTSDLSRHNLASFDDLIDVRSPSEFADDHIPGAINLPVLSDKERADVGTIYVQTSRFEARRMGAAYVSANIAHHLRTSLAAKPKSYRPLIYCWRGGMRSNSMATVLSAIGWRCCTVAGGYKMWRRRVVGDLCEDGPPYPLLLIDGQTGTAKTRIIELLSGTGTQVIDLEGLAQHRGSVFGARAEFPQPSQKLFESQLFGAVMASDLGRPIVVEAESRMIGRRALPKRFLASMQVAPRIEIKAPVRVRSKYLIEMYADLTRSDTQLAARVEDLRQYHVRNTIESWLELASRGAYQELATALMTQHYDPLYDRQRRKRADEPVYVAELQNLDDATLAQAAADIAAFVRERGNPSRMREAV
ncbi:MAG: tRNA 2-selenouridine(34) synthase MnmH [Hyphomicrobiaceae bacterium]